MGSESEPRSGGDDRSEAEGNPTLSATFLILSTIR